MGHTLGTPEQRVVWMLWPKLAGGTGGNLLAEVGLRVGVAGL